jgi:tetratricopeptide (TPR) repeat protein
MTRVRSIAVAISLALGAALPAVTLLAPAAQAAEQAQNKITTKAVAVPLKAAQEAMQKKQWDAALTDIKKAAAVEKKTPFEAYQIDEFMGFVLIQQKKFGEAAPVFERMLNSGMVPAEQVDERTKTVAQLYFQVKDYNKSAQWAKKWLDKHPNTEDMGILLGQSQYLLNDFKGAAATMMNVVNNAEKAGRKPDENWIQIVLSSQFKLDNKDGIGDALKKMVRYYPKPDYWANLLDIYRRKGNGDAMALGYYRLMNDVGVLKDKGDIVEMAQLALDAGVPGEAQATVEKGMSDGVLKVADKTEQGRYDRLLASAKKQADLDRKSLNQLAAEADKSTSGQPHIALGEAYLSYGDIDKAIAALQKGISIGTGVTDIDQANIALGMAYLKKGQKAEAKKAFDTVKDGSKWNDLADLWAIRAQSA